MLTRFHRLLNGNTIRSVPSRRLPRGAEGGEGTSVNAPLCPGEQGRINLCGSDLSRLCVGQQSRKVSLFSAHLSFQLLEGKMGEMLTAKLAPEHPEDFTL